MAIIGIDETVPLGHRTLHRVPFEDRILIKLTLASPLIIALLLSCPTAAQADEGFEGVSIPGSDVLMKALVDELDRSMSDLALDDLPKPYLIQFTAEDRVGITIRAERGGLVDVSNQRSRVAASRVRVGSYELDNTNVGGGGGRATLPIDDDYAAIRHAIWLMTDRDYKTAVEVLARKKAYLRDKQIEDRPDDFTKANAVVATEPAAKIDFNQNRWVENVKSLSARIRKYPEIQKSGVTFFAGAVNEYLVNSEGTQLRTGDTGVAIQISVGLQSKEGMRISDSVQYIGERFDQLPELEEMLADIDELCQNLVAISKAPMLDVYVGPVLFDSIPAGSVFASLLARDICARPTPLGGGRHAKQNMEKKLGLRVLPRSFNVYDDSSARMLEGEVLAGARTYDDEGFVPEKVSVVENGILKNMLSSRSPTRKIKKSNGHGFRAGLGDPLAHISCLYIESEDGLDEEALRAELLQAAREEGLEFGLRVASMRGSSAGLGRPIAMYKVYVDDGREELVRGAEFAPVQSRSLKRILAAGKERKIHNSVSGISSSIISPAILFEELELNKPDTEYDKLPKLKSPSQRM